MFYPGTHVLRIGGAFSLLALLGCGAERPVDVKEIGTLSMNLRSEANGVHYRLEGDVFTLTGTTERSLSRNGSDSLIVATLPAGDYQVELQDGWTLWKEDDLGDEQVDAQLVSENPVSFSVEGGELVVATWVFRTHGIPVTLGPPAVFNGGFAVIDTSEAGPSGVSVRANEQAHIDGLDGVSTLGGLDVSGDLGSLESLAALAGIEGDLRVLDTTALAQLDGLQQLADVGGDLVISGNAALSSLRGLSSLTAVRNVRILDNPALPTCEAHWLVDNIGALGGLIGRELEGGDIEPGEIEIAGNDDAGSCD